MNKSSGCWAVPLVCLLGCVFASASRADAENDTPDWNQETLSGDWGAVRQAWFYRGVEVGLNFKSDFLANVSGGAGYGGALRLNANAVAAFDLEKFAGWKGASALIQYHAQYGNREVNAYTGSFVGVSNIETGANTGQFYQVWLQRDFADGRWSLLGGLYAIDTEFYVTDTSGLFIQPPYGMSAEMAQTGRNGPPAFPMGALGLRLRYKGDGYFAQAALTDGVPGDPADPHGTHIHLGGGDGSLAVVEIGYTPVVGKGSYHKTAVGLWRYSRWADDLIDVDGQGDTLRRADQGVYFIAERTLMAEPGNPGQGLSGFLRFGLVNEDVYQTDWSASFGLNYLGQFDGRDDDAVGLAVTVSHVGAKYRALNGIEALETAVELTYRAQIRPWLVGQPSLQYFHSPGMDQAFEDAWLLGLRLEAVL